MGVKRLKLEQFSSARGEWAAFYSAIHQALPYTTVYRQEMRLMFLPRIREDERDEPRWTWAVDLEGGGPTQLGALRRLRERIKRFDEVLAVAEQTLERQSRPAVIKGDKGQRDVLPPEQFLLFDTNPSSPD
jgi:hypothetical protein